MQYISRFIAVLVLSMIPAGCGREGEKTGVPDPKTEALAQHVARADRELACWTQLAEALENVADAKKSAAQIQRANDEVEKCLRQQPSQVRITESDVKKFDTEYQPRFRQVFARVEKSAGPALAKCKGATECEIAVFRAMELLRHRKTRSSFTGKPARALARLRELGGQMIRNPFSSKPEFEVSLDGKSISDDNLELLRQLPPFHRLFLKDTPITGKSLQHIAGLSTVYDLFLDNSKVDSNGLRHLKNLPALKQLSLSGTGVTDDGLVHLKQLASSLETLYLSRTKITNDGLKHLLPLHRLKQLRIRKTKIDDSGIRQLHSHKTLKVIYAEGSEVTIKGQAGFKAARGGYLHLE